MIDLGSVKTVNSYRLYHDPAVRGETQKNNAMADFQLQVWTGSGAPTYVEGSEWDTVDTVSGNTDYITHRDTARTAVGRYFRLYITKPEQTNIATSRRARIQELELYSCTVAELTPVTETDTIVPSFYAKQDILNAEVTVQQTIGSGAYETSSFVTEDGVLITELNLSGDEAKTLYVKLWNRGNTADTVYDGNNSMNILAGIADDGTLYIARGTTGTQIESRAAAVTRISGAKIVTTHKLSDSEVYAEIMVDPEQTVTLTTAVQGERGLANKMPSLTQIVQNAGFLLTNMKTVSSEKAEHRARWKNYWLLSFVDLGDADLMKYYYGALYVLNCAIQNGEAAPGLFANFSTTDKVSWSGRYFQNYNFQSTFWGLLSSNRTALYQPLYEQIIAESYVAQNRAAGAGYKGVNYSRTSTPIGGNITEWTEPAAKNIDETRRSTNLDVQRSLGSFLCNDVAKYYYYTMDGSFLTRAYELVKKNLAFYLDYLEREDLNGGGYRYVVKSSRARETSPGTLNSTLDLAYCRMMLLYALDMSTRLNTDLDQHATWKDYLEHLSELPTTTYNEKTVLTEEESYPEGVMALSGLPKEDGGTGTGAGVGDNVDNMNAIFPGTVINMESATDWIETAQNTVEAMQSWKQANSFVKVFTAAARCGYDADKLIAALKERIGVQLRSDLCIYDGMHGVEKAGAIEAINSMMLQSAEGIIHVFPVWSETTDGAFTRLRTNGAFLVSASYNSTAGEVADGVTIYSEAGAEASVSSIWAQGMTVMDSKGNEVEATTKKAANDENRIIYTFQTEVGETYTLKKGVSQAELNRKAAAAVDALITAIGTPVTLASKEAIETAEEAYAALTEEQKELVSNHATLTAARTAYNKLTADKAAADAVIAKIDAIGTVTLRSRDAIDAAREACDALNPDQQALVTNYDVLTAAEDRFAQLKRQTALIIGTAISGASEPKDEFPFTDVPESAWYYDEVKNAWENGLVDGTNGTEYRPENILTVAQAIKLAAALHQLDNEGKVTLTNGRGYWYDSYVEYAVYYGIIEAKYAGYTLKQMNAAISRAEFVHIFHGAMSSYYACNSVADNAIPDVKSGDAYADEIYEFYRAGILTGSDGKGTFHPESQIRRSEVAAIPIRMYDTNARQAISLG